MESGSAKPFLAATIGLLYELVVVAAAFSKKVWAEIDDRREIDLTYLTCAEYQLFLDDMLAQGEWRQPDHWTDCAFAKGQAGEPVCGMRYEDAIEFCKWLTRRQGGGAEFRTPFASEAEKWQPENIRIAAWCSSLPACSLGERRIYRNQT
jgi:hypothetical protein